MRFQDWSSIGPTPFFSQRQEQDKFSADCLRYYVHNAVIHYQFCVSLFFSLFFFSLFSNTELIQSFPAWVLPLAVHLSQANLILLCLWFWRIHIYHSRESKIQPWAGCQNSVTYAVHCWIWKSNNTVSWSLVSMPILRRLKVPLSSFCDTSNRSNS